MRALWSGWVPLSAVACVLVACGDGGAAGPASASAPSAQHAEEVSFTSADLTLEGTLLVPERVTNEPLPAVILGHGSGPIDRDETIDGQLGMAFGFEIPVFGELAEALASAGYVVLRYDKRNCTPQTGCQNSYPPRSGTGVVDDYVVDLKAALDWLHGRDEVDVERLYYVGHSQGGQFAPELLASRSDLKAAVMLAGPHSSIDAVIGYQARFLRELVAGQGGDPDVIPELRILAEGVLELQQLREGTFAGSSIMGDTVLSWQSWLELGDRARTLLAELDRPLLALSGDYDWNVPFSETEAWRAAFAAVPSTPGHEAVVLPCVSHALNCIREPDLAQLGEDDLGQHIDPAVPAEIVRFLGQHGGAP
jgi:dienelactone hydrolase